MGPLSKWLSPPDAVAHYTRQLTDSLTKGEHTTYVSEDDKVDGYVSFDVGAVPPSDEDPVTNDVYALRRHKFGALCLARRTELMKDEHVYVGLLIVDPSTQGTGIGGKLLDIALNVAREKRVKCYLESSPVGYEFYLRRGFVDLHAPVRVVDGDMTMELPTMRYES